MAFKAGIPFKYGMSVEAKVNELWLLAPPAVSLIRLCQDTDEYPIAAQPLGPSP